MALHCHFIAHTRAPVVGAAQSKDQPRVIKPPPELLVSLTELRDRLRAAGDGGADSALFLSQLEKDVEWLGSHCGW